MVTDDGYPFEVRDRGADADVLLAGFTAYGLAGLTAVDYLVERLELEPTGFVTAESLPAITPFEDGRPHHHTRILTRDDLDVAVLHGGLFVPTFAATDFSEAIIEWTESENVTEVAVLSGVPFAHGPDEHLTYHVATEDYYDRRLADHEPAVPGMTNGFLDGVDAALVERGMISDLAVGTFLTPVHDRIPDADAAIRLVESVTDLYDLDVDTGPLEEFASDVEDYYTRLRERLDAVPEQERSQDRMFM